MVKLAVVAVLSTMLVRFPWFRRILLTEKRDWPERLIFAASLGLPLTAGVVARLLLNYNAADLTLAGLVPRRPAGRALRRRDRRRRWSASRRSSPASGSRCPSRSAAASPAAACARSVRRKRSGTSRRSSSPTCTGNVWRLVRRFQIDWVVILLAAPIGLEIIRAGARPPASARAHLLPRAPPRRRGSRVARRRRDGAVRRDSDQDLEQRAHRAPAAGAGEAADGGARRGARQPDQPALPVQHADVDLVADPLAAGDGAHADRQAVGPAAPAAAQPGALRHAARGARGDRRISRHREHPLRPEAAHREVDRPGQPRHRRAEHAAAAAGRELDQARAVAEDRRRAHHDPQRRARTGTRSSTSSTTASASRPATPIA